MDVPQETTVDTQCRHVTEHPPQETSIIAMHTESGSGGGVGVGAGGARDKTAGKQRQEGCKEHK